MTARVTILRFLVKLAMIAVRARSYWLNALRGKDALYPLKKLVIKKVGVRSFSYAPWQ